VISKSSPYSTFILVFLFFYTISYAASPGLRVEVKGVKGRLKDNVFAILEIYQERNEKPLTEARIETLFKKGFLDIKKALIPFGYFDPEISGTLKRDARGGLVATYLIQKGPVTKIATIKVEVVGPGRDDLLPIESMPFKPGERFRQRRYERFKDGLLKRAQGLGYLDAHFKIHQVLIDVKNHKANIHLRLDTGPRYHFGRLTFKETTLSPLLLRGYADFKKGQPFDVTLLGRFRSRLLDSDYFRDVKIDYSKGKNASGNLVPVVVSCPMKKPNVFRFGLGYVSDVGPRVSLEWRRRYFGKNGHHLRGQFRYSSEETMLSGEYFIPLDRPYSDYFSLRPFIEHYDTDSRTGWKYNVATTYSVVLSNGWRRNAGINLGYENYDAAGEKKSSGELVPFISWYKSVADNILYANRGYSIKIGLSGEVGNFFANRSYLSSFLNTKFIRRLNPNYRIISRLDAGAIVTSDVTDIPSSARFYAGGQNSIRGFSLEELGPVNKETGKVTGGKYLAVGSLELERHLYKQVSGALFVDAGNAFDPKYQNKIEVGTGLGLRFKTVLGPVRLDFGFGISHKSVPFKFYLSVGPDF